MLHSQHGGRNRSCAELTGIFALVWGGGLFFRPLIKEMVVLRSASASASQTPSHQDSYLPDTRLHHDTNQDGIIVLRKLGLRNLPKMYV